MIRGLAHVCIAARDLDATERFYCEGLGFSKAFDFIRGGQVVGFYLKAPDATYIEVFHQDAVQADGDCPIRHVCLEVLDIDALSRHLTALGHEVTAKQLGADQSWQAWTKDPSGVHIELHEYTQSSSQITGRNCLID
jgi:glyoxylase I family protein